MSEATKLQFFVYMIESPSPIDIYKGINECELIASVAKINGFPFIHKIVINEEAFRASFFYGLSEAMKIYPEFLPIIHISAHGSSEGISLSNDDIITWNKLKDILIPINAELNNNLLINISSCEGFSGIKMAMNFEEKLPFAVLISSSTKPTWAETGIGYATFYHWLVKGYNLVEAINKMIDASGYSDFKIDTGVGVQNWFIDSLSKDKLENARNKINEYGISDTKKRKSSINYKA